MLRQRATVAAGSAEKSMGRMQQVHTTPPPQQRAIPHFGGVVFL
jgi:hypothetical protein